MRTVAGHGESVPHGKHNRARRPDGGRRAAIRHPIWPGTCGKWHVTYRRGSAEVEFTLTLYRTHRQALVALAEPAFGDVEILPNGAAVRTSVTDDTPTGALA